MRNCRNKWYKIVGTSCATPRFWCIFKSTEHAFASENKDSYLLRRDTTWECAVENHPGQHHHPHTNYGQGRTWGSMLRSQSEECERAACKTTPGQASPPRVMTTTTHLPSLGLVLQSTHAARVQLVKRLNHSTCQLHAH